jgi:hypothetical protein
MDPSVPTINTCISKYLICPTVINICLSENICFPESGSRRIAVAGNFEAHESYCFNFEGKWHIYIFKISQKF